MVEVLIALGLGCAPGYLLRKKPRILRASNRLASIAVFALLFLLGVALGVNDKLLSQLPRLGGYSLALAVLAIAGSVLLAALLYRKLLKQPPKKYEE